MSIVSKNANEMNYTTDYEYNITMKTIINTIPIIIDI